MNASIYLNLGSGNVKLPGFINIDLGPQADMQLDLTKQLPWPDRSVHGIYSEHFIEHLSQAEAINLMHECRRVLMPGGVFRIATPDLDVIVQDYVGDVTRPTWAEYGYYWVNNRCERLNLSMREWGHKWLFNEEELVRLATMVGFSVRARCELGQSADEVFRNLETRDSSRLIVEFEKPDRTLAANPRPLVSILIPSYNPPYFVQALDSAISQTYENLEIVICDDCRTDEIKTIALEYASRDSRIRYMQNPERLRRGNMLKCFDEAQGEFVKFLNDDDVLEPTCVERMLECFSQYPDISLVTSRRQRIDEHGRPLPDIIETIPPVDTDALIEGLSLGAALLSWGHNFVGEPTTAMFRKRDLAAIKPDFMSVDGCPIRAVNDFAIWMHLAMRGDVIYLIDPLSKFRIHPNQNQQLMKNEIGDLAQEGLSIMRNAWQRFGFAADQLYATIKYYPLMDPSLAWRLQTVKKDESGWMPLSSGDAPLLSSHEVAPSAISPSTSSTQAPPASSPLIAGTQLLEAGQLDQAYALLSQALAATPDNPDVLIQLGRLALAANMPDEAGDFFREAASGSGEGLQKIHRLGSELVDGGRVEEGRVVLDALLKSLASVASDVMPAKD